jgi:hypothetical protein
MAKAKDDDERLDPKAHDHDERHDRKAHAPPRVMPADEPSPTRGGGTGDKPAEDKPPTPVTLGTAPDQPDLPRFYTALVNWLRSLPPEVNDGQKGDLMTEAVLLAGERPPEVARRAVENKVNHDASLLDTERSAADERHRDDLNRQQNARRRKSEDDE